MKIGIPQALLYYKYFPQWKTFLTELGQEVVVSAATNKRILKRGTSLAENEACVPVKVFYGHVLDLANKVDAIFIPRVVSVERRAYTCPKFLGLPDIIQAIDVDLPTIIAPTFNVKLGRRKYYQAFQDLGKMFTRSKARIALAYLRSLKALKEHEHNLLAGRTPWELLGEEKLEHPPSGRLRVGVVGHPYNVYDPFISMNLIKRLQSQGIQPLTSETVSKRLAEKEASRLPKDLFWTYEKDVVGSVFYWLKHSLVDGIIYMLSFACGPDSLIQVLIEHEAKKRLNIPVMPLVVDEHTSETGIITRLEAFMDMIVRKRGITYEDNLAPHGTS